MFDVRRTETFSDWLSGLRDRAAKAIIARRIARVAQGNFGDVKPIGAGLSELRINQGPGYRVYLTQRGAQVVILLCGGDKGSQPADIKRAQRMAKELDDDGD